MPFGRIGACRSVERSIDRSIDRRALEPHLEVRVAFVETDPRRGRFGSSQRGAAARSSAKPRRRERANAMAAPMVRMPDGRLIVRVATATARTTRRATREETRSERARAMARDGG